MVIRSDAHRSAQAASGSRGPAQPIIVLVQPQLGENIGAAARAMLNFGLERLHIVDPRDGWPSGSAIAMASGAGRVLDEAQLFPDVSSATANASWVVATTARQREINKPQRDPRSAMREAARRTAGGQQVAILFGGERAGLTNAQLASASIFMTIPTNAECASLNLAQSVVVTAYQWSQSIDRSAPSTGQPAPATIAARDHLVRQFEADLERAGYFWPESKSAGMRLNLRNLLMRLDLSESDVRVMHGVRRALGRMVRSHVGE